MLSGLEILADGRYRSLELLGQGGMATVFKAWDTRLEVHRAIKVLNPAMAGKKILRARFLAEAQTMAKLHHPHIVTVHDVVTEDPYIYLVMELVDAGDLMSLVERDGPMLPSQAISLISQTLDALQFAHDRGVIHRDIKPQNILLTSRQVAKVTDFGIARVLDRERPLTEAGVLMGTLDFMAPELRMQSQGATAASDLYAAAATLFVLLTGKTPSRLHALEPDDERLVGIPPEICEVIRAATRESPDERLFSAHEMRQRLSRAMPGSTVAPHHTDGGRDQHALHPPTARAGSQEFLPDTAVLEPGSRADGEDNLPDEAVMSETTSRQEHYGAGATLLPPEQIHRSAALHPRPSSSVEVSRDPAGPAVAKGRLPWPWAALSAMLLVSLSLLAWVRWSQREGPAPISEQPGAAPLGNTDSLPNASGVTAGAGPGEPRQVQQPEDPANASGSSQSAVVQTVDPRPQVSTTKPTGGVAGSTISEPPTAPAPGSHHPSAGSQPAPGPATSGLGDPASRSASSLGGDDPAPVGDAAARLASPSSQSAPQAATNEPAADDAAAVATLGGPGMIWVKSMPPSKIFIDGTPVGSSHSWYELSPGTHQLRLLDGQGREKIRTFTLGENQRARFCWNFERDTVCPP